MGVLSTLFAFSSGALDFGHANRLFSGSDGPTNHTLRGPNG